MLTQAKVIRGVMSMVICDYTTGKPKYMHKTIESVKIEPVKEESSLVVPRGTADTDSEITGYKLSYVHHDNDDDIIEHLTGGERTDYTATSTGEIVDIENIDDGDVLDTTTGCWPAIDASDIENLKPGIYRIEAKDTNTVKLYALSDAAFKEGDNGEYLDDSLLIADDVDITADTSTGITGWGIKLIGGTGTIGMTAGKIGTFRVRRADQAGTRIRVGGVGTDFDLVSAAVYLKKKNGIYRAIDIFKFRPSGMSFSADKDYSKNEISVPLIYDEAKDGYYDWLVE